MITSAVLSAAVALAAIVISEVRQTRELASAVQAYAAAESDIERALFVFRKGGETQLREEDVVGRTVEEARPASPFTIAENDFVSIPIPDEWTRDTIGIERWSPGASCSVPEESWIEVSQIFWDPSVGDGTGFVTDRQPFSYSAEPFNIAIQRPTLDLLEVRVRALFCDIEEFSTDIPSRLIVSSTAEAQEVQQTAEITIPRVAPAAGLFDFVIFSECEIIKGIAADPRCPD